MLSTLIETLLGSADSCQNYFEPLEFEELVYTIEEAHKDIFEFKCHVLRTFSQNAAWNELKDAQEPGVVFVTSDWAMKWIGRQHRETQKEWFGKVSLPILNYSNQQCYHSVFSSLGFPGI
jgi:hypothetical protein